VNLDVGVVHSSGSFAWRKLIIDALEENRWALFVQPVVSLHAQSTIHHEIFSRLIDSDGEMIPAGQFMPMALRHRLMENVDRAIITLILEMLANAANRFKDVAVHISIQAIENPEFCEWLLTRLNQSKTVVHRLSVELSEFGCAKDIELTSAFVQSIRGLGVRFGVDHFGLDPRSLNLLRQVPPDYIKLDGGLVKESLVSETSRAHLRSIIAVAKSLEIQVIALNVEGEELVSALASDGVDGGQGYYFGAPEPM
jgi:EAL domain-containing protein (putative c-di-GMP-specific phosphodiesterase class I)